MLAPCQYEKDLWSVNPRMKYRSEATAGVTEEFWTLTGRPSALNHAPFPTSHKSPSHLSCTFRSLFALLQFHVISLTLTNTISPTAHIPIPNSKSQSSSPPLSQFHQHAALKIPFPSKPSQTRAQVSEFPTNEPPKTNRSYNSERRTENLSMLCTPIQNN
jgi:hypothetical protein